ncbi:hypothetical protein CA13_11190 [Planctomycetes bacterium CA13]|uniref:Uncharacterized protein n=1 Tax=Novipirellula herctigrandis TaxID=2527986 RepID=A0A5C5YXG3_9BACT|nr:hypothetical protein CA13_11190 [Planctomycetes bacterium CA13]
MPRLENGIHYLPTPGKGYSSGYGGARQFGWPVAIATEPFSARTPYATTYSPIDHALGRDDIAVYDKANSMMTGVTLNLIFFATAVLSAAIVI